MKPLLLCLLLTTAQASAGLITLNATNSGFYNDAGTRIAGNYFTGWSVGQPPGEARNFFVFNLSGVSGTITGATLRLSSTNNQAAGYLSQDASETLSLFDVSTPLNTLINGTGGVSAFTDLGTGTVYGSSVIPKPQNLAASILNDIALNATGLAYLQSNVGANQVAFGGALNSLARGITNEAMYNSTNSTLTRQLILTTEDSAANPVPEPATMLLAGLALITLTAAKRK